MPSTTYDSRLKTGRLTFKTTGASPVTLDVACQARSVKLVPPAKQSDSADEVLNGNTLSSESQKQSWTMQLKAVQDFTNLSGLIFFALDHDDEVVEYVWQPNATAHEWYGTLRMQPIEIGGDVAKRGESDLTLTLLDGTDGKPSHRAHTDD